MFIIATSAPWTQLCLVLSRSSLSGGTHCITILGCPPFNTETTFTHFSHLSYLSYTYDSRVSVFTKPSSVSSYNISHELPANIINVL
jgi:hypothetical protein